MVGLTAGVRLHLSIGPLSTKTGETQIPENFLGRLVSHDFTAVREAGFLSACSLLQLVNWESPQVSVGAGSAWSRLLGNDHRRGRMASLHRRAKEDCTQPNNSLLLQKVVLEPKNVLTRATNWVNSSACPGSSPLLSSGLSVTGLFC